MRNLCKTKWLLTYSCNPLNSNTAYHLNSLGKILDYHLPQHDRILLTGDLKKDFINEKHKEDFCDICYLKNLIKETTCLTIPITPLILIYS